MSFWNIFSWFRKKTEGSVSGDEVLNSEKKEKFINTIVVGSFFSSKHVHRLDNRELVSSEFTVSPEKMNNFPITGEGKVFDMKLRNKQNAMFKSMTSADMNEMMFAVLMNHMRVNSYKEEFPDLYDRLFSGSGDNFAIAYCLAQKQVIEKNMDDLLNSVEIKNNLIRTSGFDKQLVVSFYQDVINFMRILSQVYPAFAKDLIQLNVFENFFKTFQNKMSLLVKTYNLNILNLLELHNSVITLMSDFIVRVIETEGKIKSEARLDNLASGDFREKIFMKPFSANGISKLPFDGFSYEVNALLNSVRANLENVSAKFIEDDLSNEIPKMFESVLGDMIKNFLAMPEAFRTTMSNDAGKTVDMMLFDVLNVINNRLIVIAEESHKSTLREVSVIDEFSKRRWIAEEQNTVNQ